MKRYTSILPLACCLLLALAACTPQTLDELAPGTNADARPLAISVTDGGHSSATQTRAEEKNFTTVFTDRDQIGLYVVKDGEIKRSNLRLTLLNGKWTLPIGTPQLVYSPGASYYAYYPYKDDTYMADKVSIPSSGDDIFAPLVDTWQPAFDQDTHKAYTASDLMTARGECRNENGNYTLNFQMQHRMGMLLLTCVPPVPSTGDLKYHHEGWMMQYFNGNPKVDGGLTYYCKGYRYLVNPANNNKKYKMTYKNGATPMELTGYFNPLPGGGRYLEYVANENADVNFVLAKVGDYYMDDGTIVYRDWGVMPEGCIGIVFSVGDPTAQDPILARDHPKCTHGLVVALKDAADAGIQWSAVQEDVNSWTNSADRGANKVDIRNATLKQGYANTKALRAYNRANAGKKVVPVEYIDRYAVPYPAGSSGWYLPSISSLMELANSGIAPADFQNAGGEGFSTDYWSSSEFDDAAGYYGLFSPLPSSSSFMPKTNTSKVRAVLAF